MAETTSGSGGQMNLSEISTRWSCIGDPSIFALRYSRAIQAYLEALIRNKADAADLAQDFFLQFVQRGLPRAAESRGRFRDYLKVAVRNAALTHLRKRRDVNLSVESLPLISREHEDEADRRWREECRQQVVDRVLRLLDLYERENPGNYAHSVLRVSIEPEAEDSERQAELVSQRIGKQMNAVAFRKQRSRARDMFAKLVVNEIRVTIDTDSNDRLEEELADLDLLRYVKQRLDDGPE